MLKLTSFMQAIRDAWFFPNCPKTHQNAAAYLVAILSRVPKIRTAEAFMPEAPVAQLDRAPDF